MNHVESRGIKDLSVHKIHVIFYPNKHNRGLSIDYLSKCQASHIQLKYKVAKAVSQMLINTTETTHCSWQSQCVVSDILEAFISSDAVCRFLWNGCVYGSFAWPSRLMSMSEFVNTCLSHCCTDQHDQDVATAKVATGCRCGDGSWCFETLRPSLAQWLCFFLALPTIDGHVTTANTIVFQLWGAYGTWLPRILSTFVTCTITFILTAHTPGLTFTHTAHTHSI